MLSQERTPQRPISKKNGGATDATSILTIQIQFLYLISNI